MRITVGRIVHFHDRTRVHAPFAAIVVRVFEDDHVLLKVWDELGCEMNVDTYKVGNPHVQHACGWDWPSREETRVSATCDGLQESTQ